ncbi:MAG: GGDEF domain-containing protein [Bacillota bacterium]
MVLVATDLAKIQKVLEGITVGITAVILLIVLLSGIVSYKFASTFEKTAVTDGLMGIYNHKYFKQRLEEEVAKSKRYGQQTSLVLFDIDFFKRVNDTYGHATGDLVLKLMAKWVTDMVRNTDVVCRYGGEEIACILPHTSIAGAQEFAERLRLKISEQVVHDPEEDAKFRVTVSVGVSQWEKGMEMMDVMKAADAALYHSKRTGRNRVTIYQEELLPAPQEMASKPERTKDRH